MFDNVKMRSDVTRHDNDDDDWTHTSIRRLVVYVCVQDPDTNIFDTPRMLHQQKVIAATAAVASCVCVRRTTERTNEHMGRMCGFLSVRFVD